MLQNAYLLAKIGADTAENEQDFAEILPKTAMEPESGRPGARDRIQVQPGGAAKCTALWEFHPSYGSYVPSNDSTRAV